MFAGVHSDINSLKFGLLHLTAKLKDRAVNVKGGIRD
jgi:hypothetical protein